MLQTPRVCVLIVAAVLVAHAQWLNHPSPGTPRTKDGKPNLLAKPPRLSGKPDLSGVWQVQAPPKGEIERLLGGEALAVGIVPGDDLNTFSKYFFNVLADFTPAESPLRPEAAEIMRQRPKNSSPDSRCLPVGIPRVELLGFPFKIVQTPGLAVVLYEADNTRRQIYLDGRKLPADPNPTWLGYSIARWEGEVLVVDSAGFSDKVWLDAFGHPAGESTHVQERFHRRDFGHMDLQVTITDTKLYSKPIMINAVELLMPDSDILEYFCAENEKDHVHLK